MALGKLLSEHIFYLIMYFSYRKLMIGKTFFYLKKPILVLVSDERFSDTGRKSWHFPFTCTQYDISLLYLHDVTGLNSKAMIQKKGIACMT